MFNHSTGAAVGSSYGDSTGERSLTINLLREPDSVPYCYVDQNNTLCPVIPVSGALAVAKDERMIFAFNRDNTCKTTEALKEYLRKAVSSLQEYQQKLEGDIRTEISINRSDIPVAFEF